MNPIRQIRRIAGVLAGACALLALAAASPAMAARIPDPGPASRSRTRGPTSPRPRPAPDPRRDPHRPGGRHARLADHPDRRRRRTAGGRGGGARGPGPGRPPARDRHGRLSHARRSSGAASRRARPGGALRPACAGRPA